MNAVRTHTLKRVPSQKCSLHFSVLTPIKVHSRTCSLHSASSPPLLPKNALSKVFTPVKSARPKVLTLRKLLSSKCLPFQKCSSHFAHPPKSALLKVLTPLKNALPKGLTLKKVLIPQFSLGVHTPHPSHLHKSFSPFSSISQFSPCPPPPSPATSLNHFHYFRHFHNFHGGYPPHTTATSSNNFHNFHDFHCEYTTHIPVILQDGTQPYNNLWVVGWDIVASGSNSGPLVHHV